VKIAVIGLGYIGLTVLTASASAGYNTYGYDLSKDVIRAIDEEIIADRKKTDAYLFSVLRNSLKRVHMSSEYDENLLDADAKFICVDTINVGNAVGRISGYLKKGDLVIIESTIDPEMCDDIKDLIELLVPHLKVGRNIALAFSPERVMEGRLLENYESMPRPIGTYSLKDYNKVALLYENLGVKGELSATTPQNAVAAKLFENAFRFLEISIANEFADICRESHLDFNKIRELVNAKGNKMGYNEILKSGIGIGGPCIPMAADIIHDLNPPNSNLLSVAIEMNMGRPESVAKAIVSMLENEIGGLNKRRICVLGATYRANGYDWRHSPANDVAATLAYYIEDLTVCDPNWLEDSAGVKKVSPDKLDEEFDGVIVLLAHDCFRDLSGMKSKLFLDITGIDRLYPTDAKVINLRV
jgi:UDP-N-acetyl-D-mannosaminuronic acid dehydrogenase